MRASAYKGRPGFVRSAVTVVYSPYSIVLLENMAGPDS